MHKKKWGILSLSCLLAGGMALAPAGWAQAVLAKEFTQKELVQASQQAGAVPSTAIPRSIASLLQNIRCHFQENGICLTPSSFPEIRSLAQSMCRLSVNLREHSVYLKNDLDGQLKNQLIAAGKEFSKIDMLLSDPGLENFTNCEMILDQLFAKADSSAPAGVATQFMDALKKQGKLDLVMDGWLEANKFIENIQGNEDPVLVDAQNKVQSLQTRQAEFVLSQCLSDLYSGYSAELEHIMDNLEPFGNNPYQWIMKDQDENQAAITLNLTFGDSEAGAKFIDAQLLNLDEQTNINTVSSVIAADGKSAQISFSLKPGLTFSGFFRDKNTAQIQVDLEKTFIEGEEFKKDISIQASWSVSNVSHQMDAGTILTDIPVIFSFEMRPAQCSLGGPGPLDFFTAKQSPNTPANPSDPAGKPLNPPASKPSDKPSEEKKPVNLYRLYNPNSGEHFYTSSQAEKKHLINLGWKDEGIGWVSPASSAHPVYRLYNPNAGDHHYTMNIQEQKSLLASGWKDEGIGWYSLPAGQGIPVYRQYNPNAEKAGAHNFTINKAENDYLISVGWKNEGFAWYAEK